MLSSNVQISVLGVGQFGADVLQFIAPKDESYHNYTLYQSDRNVPFCAKLADGHVSDFFEHTRMAIIVLDPREARAREFIKTAPDHNFSIFFVPASSSQSPDAAPAIADLNKRLQQMRNADCHERIASCLLEIPENTGELISFSAHLVSSLATLSSPMPTDVQHSFSLLSVSHLPPIIVSASTRGKNSLCETASKAMQKLSAEQKRSAKALFMFIECPTNTTLMELADANAIVENDINETCFITWNHVNTQEHDFTRLSFIVSL